MTPAFNYTTGNPDRLIGGGPATMGDIQGSFYDLRAYLNSGILDQLNALSPPATIATAAPVLDIGQLNQLRAGRQLGLTDFTNLGLAAPAGLWNLTDLSDASGNARALTNKGTVPFGVGINGIAGTAAAFAGSTAQALYIADTGAADPFRIRTGSWGCWFRTAKRGADQGLVSKVVSGGATGSFFARLTTANVLRGIVYVAGAALTVDGFSDVADDRWHFGVVTYDGTRLLVYVDGAREATGTSGGPLDATAGPLNIGGYAGDASTAAANPHYGRVDEAFVTAEVLTDDQVRNLYCGRLVHALGVVPNRTNLLVRRRRRGATLPVTSFPAQPVRLHNFTAGSLNDEGSGGVALAANPGTGAIVDVAGADGLTTSAKSFSGAHAGLSSTDAGLPAALVARSAGLWFKTALSQNGVLLGYGTITTAELRLDLFGGQLRALSAGDVITAAIVIDGFWHHLVVTEDNAAADGVKRKFYMDGRLVGGSTVMNSITLAGANRFRIAALQDGTLPFTGQIDAPFVYAGALSSEQIRTLYDTTSQALAPTPKDAADHIEAVRVDALLATFDTIETSDLIDMQVGA